MSSVPVPPGETGGGWRLAARKAVPEEAQQALAYRLAGRYARLREALTSGESVPNLLALARVSRRKISTWGERLETRSMQMLLRGNGTAPERIARFAEELGDPEGLYLGAEFLRAWDPRDAWPWTPWLLHLGTGNGALTLATGTGIGAADGTTALYLRVGERLALIATGERFTSAERLETFLAVIYALYSRAVITEQLSEEFNRVLPDLTETVERLLGIRGFAAAERPAQKGGHEGP